MTEERKRIIREIVKELKQMDLFSLELTKNNTELLRTRDAMEAARKTGQKKHLSEILPNLPDSKKERILGVAEGMNIMKENMETKKTGQEKER